MPIKERIIQLIEYKKIPKEEFYIRIGMTSANFRGKAKTTPLNSTAIENILSIIPDTNPEWLLTGKGSMLKKDQKNDSECGDSENKLTWELIKEIGNLRQQLGEQINENTHLQAEIEELKKKEQNKSTQRHSIYSGSNIAAEPQE